VILYDRIEVLDLSSGLLTQNFFIISSLVFSSEVVVRVEKYFIKTNNAGEHIKVIIVDRM